MGRHDVFRRLLFLSGSAFRTAPAAARVPVNAPVPNMCCDCYTADERLKDLATTVNRMQPEPIAPEFSLKCHRCAKLGVPLRVDSQTPTTIVIALRCNQCSVEWIANGDLPVFLAWVKPDRRRTPRVRIH